MKPIVIYADKSDKITLTKKEFEKYVNDAYDAGYYEGYASGQRSYVSPWWTNTQPTITTPNTQPLKITWDSDHTDYTPHITCDALNDISNTKGVLKHEET